MCHCHGLQWACPAPTCKWLRLSGLEHRTRGVMGFAVHMARWLDARHQHPGGSSWNAPPGDRQGGTARADLVVGGSLLLAQRPRDNGCCGLGGLCVQECLCLCVYSAGSGARCAHACGCSSSAGLQLCMRLCAAAAAPHTTATMAPHHPTACLQLSVCVCCLTEASASLPPLCV